MTIMGIYVLRSFGMAFIMMPMVTAAINALPGRLLSNSSPKADKCCVVCVVITVTKIAVPIEPAS
jgi:hypothetical protein